MINFSPSAKFNKKAAVVCVSEEQLKLKKYSFTQKNIEAEIKRISKAKIFSAKTGEMFAVEYSGSVIVFLGVGSGAKITPSAFRVNLRKALLAKLVKSSGSVEIVSHTDDEEIIIAAIEAVTIGCYTFSKYKTDNNTSSATQNYTIVAKNKKEYNDCITISDGVNCARDLVNENADITVSKFLEAKVKSIVRGAKNVSLEVLGRKEMIKKKLGLHLAVNKGSINEPKLVIIKYSGGAKTEKYKAIIGKGLTFDTGGLNHKPTGSIEAMRMDMGGTAAVIGTLSNIIKLKPHKNILFVCAIAENVTGAKSYKPGDILTSYSGKTVEVANTDAEGRLVLADAISYVVKNYKPGKVIDVATLTGACIVALGLDYTGLVSSDEKLAADLVRSSKITDDRVWRLPSYPELEKSVSSQFADIRNLGSPKGAGGALTAAEFLRQFTEDTIWAHLDIAGTAFVEGAERMYFGHGATGSGVRLLTHYLMHN